MDNLTMAQILLLIVLFFLVMSNTLVIILIYHAIRTVIRTKKAVVKLVENPDLQKIFKSFSRRENMLYPDEDHDNGYITGIHEMLIEFHRDFPNQVYLLMEIANHNTLIKVNGQFEIRKSSGSNLNRDIVVFVESAERIKRQEEKD